MTRQLLKPELRFKLDVIAAKYNVPSSGRTIGQVVTRIVKEANDLTSSEKSTLEQICKVFGTSLKDLERGKGE